MHLPVLLDVGHSIDDYFAIAAAASSPELTLLGVTTVHDADARAARIMRSLLDAYGRTDVPVVAGAGTHHEPEYITAALRALEKEGHLSHRPVESGAADRMERLLGQHRDVTVIATGPLTNLADLFDLAPHLSTRIRELLFVGGWATQALPDYNVRLDPEGAARVLRHDVPLTTIGYEVTRGLRIFPTHLERLSKSTEPGPQMLGILLRNWCQLKSATTPPMADPAAIAYVCNQLPATIETTHVAVRTAPGLGRGALYQDTEGGRPIRMFTRIDASGYMDFLMERVAPEPPAPTDLSTAEHLAGCDLQLSTAYQLDHFPGWSVHDARHSSHIVALILVGEAEAHLHGERFSLKAGSVLYVQPGQSRSIKSEDGMSALWFYFDVLEGGAGTNQVPVPALPWPTAFSCLPDIDTLAEIGRRVVKYWQYARPEGPLLCSAALVELITHLHPYTQSPLAAKAQSPSQQAALHAKRWIEARVTEKLSLDGIAKHVALDKYHLLRVFKEQFGVPPLQYQRQLRMEQALKLLQADLLSVAEVAASVGYNSVHAFSRAFKRHYGLSPSQAQKGRPASSTTQAPQRRADGPSAPNPREQP